MGVEQSHWWFGPLGYGCNSRHIQGAKFYADGGGASGSLEEFVFMGGPGRAFRGADLRRSAREFEHNSQSPGNSPVPPEEPLDCPLGDSPRAVNRQPESGGDFSRERLLSERV